MLDNGIAATAFLLTAGVPLIAELGASLDVLFAVIVIGVRPAGCGAHSAAPTWTNCGSCATDDPLAARAHPRARRRVDRRPDRGLAPLHRDADGAVGDDVLVCGSALGFRVGSGQHFALGGLLRADAPRSPC